jgi:hypothetical protein
MVHSSPVPVPYRDRKVKWGLDNGNQNIGTECYINTTQLPDWVMRIYLNKLTDNPRGSISRWANYLIRLNILLHPPYTGLNQVNQITYKAVV